MTLPNQVNPLLQAPASTAYTINNSLRFRSSASAYLSRTFAAAPIVRTQQTISVWLKRGTIGTGGWIFDGYDGSSTYSAGFYITNSDTLEFDFGGSSLFNLVTTQVFRDPSSWYHILYSIDTTQATAANRIKLYVNGVQVTAFSTANYPAQNAVSQLALNNGNNKICTNFNTTGGYLDCYLAEFNFIDGQALTPSSFGAYNSYGVWQPARYTGSYGTNGFYLKFASFGTAAALGTDSSGNGNTWTVNNVSVTAGTTYDPMLDSPTLTSATVCNYPVLNPIFAGTSGTLDGNMNFGLSSTMIARSTFLMSSGKWYAEFTMVAAGANSCRVGISGSTSTTTANYLGSDAVSWGYTQINGVVYNNAGAPYTYATYANGDIIGVAFDATGGNLSFYKNGTLQGTIASIPAGSYYFAVQVANSTPIGWACNFGQRAFSYTPPSGFVALNAYNLPTPTIPNGATVMAATTYTGNGANNRPISNGGSMQPDLAWVKNRTSAYDNVLVDSVRGYTVALSSNLTQNEAYFGQLFDNATINGSNYNGFYPGGFIVNGNFRVNNNTDALVGWQWKAGGPGGSSNTNGSITSTVSVNATAGFSVVTFTAPASGSATVGHGLGVTPNFFTVKARNSTDSWVAWHSSLSSTTDSYLLLNTTAAVASSSAIWGTGPTSTVIGIGTSSYVPSATHVAYCWSAVAGYSAFGSYTGNGSADGPFVYTGFRPRWIMIKRTDTTANWRILDTSRDTYNVESAELYPNLSNAESAFASLDGLSNGFKIRNTDSAYNASGGTYVYAAFAENPFKYALAR